MKGMGKILRFCLPVRVCLLALLCFFVLQGSWCAIVWAKAVPSSLAQEVVNGWLAKEAKPMGSRLGSEVENVETFTDSNGQPVYYVVVLKPSGFVVVSADDLVEPIVCFSSGGSYDSSERNPLGALVSRDIPARINVSRSVHAKLLAGSSTGDLTKKQAMVHKSGEKAFAKWTGLLSRWGGHSVSGAEPVSSVSDVRVSPFLQTTWGQDVICNNRACYNYYTPGGYGNGDPSNYPAGCVATAMAQYMRFWQYPVSGVGISSFTITVDGANQTAHLRGGNGSGGAYNWSQMLLAPDCSTTLAQREAIGDLTYDAGVAVKMDYEYDGSGAFISDAATAMVNTFGYSNAIEGGDEIDNIGDGLNGMINPNLDYGNPVILGISDSSGDGHAVVADGYGYQSSTLYHHLNMGWDGDDDVWYNLPNIDAASIDPTASSFSIVDSTIYNIYISGTGEIISGRVTASDATTPISSAAVTAVMTGGGTYQATTNASGIYAFANVPSNSTYTISVASYGHSFTNQTANTGLSQNNAVTSGNCWGIDFVSSQDVVAVPVVGSFASSVSGEVTFTAWTDSNYPVTEVYFYLRSPNGGEGAPIGYESMPADFNYTSGEWQYSFDTTQVSNGNYVILARSVDVDGETGWSGVVPVSIVNAAAVAGKCVVGKCTVTAGSNNNDAISFSGTLDATMDEISAASGIVVDINSADMVDDFVQTFPRNSTTFKNYKFNCTITDAGKPPLKTSFAFNTNTSAFSFTAKNVDLSGLSCPLTVRIGIGAYGAETDVDEAIVNGAKPIPINLLMGVQNSLRVDKQKFTRDKNTSYITQVAVSGGFSDKNANDVNLLSYQLNITVGSQTFKIPAGNFKDTNGKFTCSNVKLYDVSSNLLGIAAATFDFNKGVFTLTIKKTDFPADAGVTDFGIVFGGFSGSDVVTLPPP
ncbi:MAG: C10 family peptidase [Sedimentisphaerales bacterium]|jgi:hypothetical protein